MSLSPTGTGIGQPVRRREDLRLLTGRGRYSDDINVPGQAYAVMVRSPHAHARIRSIDVARGDRGARRACGADRARPAGGRPEADPACGADRPSGRHPAREHATARRRSFRRTIRWPRTRCAMSATSSPWWSPTSRAAAKDAAELVVVDYAALPAVVHSRDAVAPDAPLRLVGRRIEYLPRCHGWRRRGDRRGVRRRRARGAAQHLGAAHRRRDDGAARGGRRIRCGDRTLHAACRRRRRGASAARHGRGARRRRR